MSQSNNWFYTIEKMQLQFMPDQTKKIRFIRVCNCYINMLTLGARSTSDFVLSYGLSDFSVKHYCMYVQVTLWISYTLGAVEIHHSYWYHGVIPSDMKYWLYVNYLWDFSKWTDAALKLSKACIRIKVPQVKTKWGNVKTLINEVLVLSIIRLFLMNCSRNIA